MKYYALVLHKRVGVGIVSPEIFCFFMTQNGMGWDCVIRNILFFCATKRWKGYLYPDYSSWLCVTGNYKKGVSSIFLIGSFIEFCKNRRKSKMGEGFRLFMSWWQCGRTKWSTKLRKIKLRG